VGDKVVQSEWCAFLEAHKGTLRYLDLSFGRGNMGLALTRNMIHDKRAEFLVDNLMPVLQVEGWDNLASLVLEGVPLEDRKIDLLRCALPGAGLVVLPEQWWVSNEEPFQESLDVSQMWGARQHQWSDEVHREPQYQ